jgi:hypothetical protein
VGYAFLIHRVRAQNVATESDNKIHDDQVAATYGFRGGLVPGVTVYGYMTTPVVEMAPEWLERGSMTLRLIEPFYDGEEVLVLAERGNDGSIAVTAEREDGTVCARGTASIRKASLPQPPRLPEHPLPTMEQRPAPSSDNVIPGELRGTVVAPLDLSAGGPIPNTCSNIRTTFWPATSGWGRGFTPGAKSTTGASRARVTRFPLAAVFESDSIARATSSWCWT